MRATWAPDPAAPGGVARLVLVASAPAAGGALAVYRRGARAPVRAAGPAAAVRAVLRAWAASERAGRGTLTVRA
jgi:hypothetical protein